MMNGLPRRSFLKGVAAGAVLSQVPMALSAPHVEAVGELGQFSGFTLSSLIDAKDTILRETRVADRGYYIMAMGPDYRRMLLEG